MWRLPGGSGLSEGTVHAETGFQSSVQDGLVEALMTLAAERD